jgi:hypothetical protein
MKIIKVSKFGKELSVQEHLLGKHREHCLCYQNCIHFKKDTTENCDIAQNLYLFNMLNSVTTPVWECQKYKSNE